VAQYGKVLLPQRGNCHVHLIQKAALVAHGTMLSIQKKHYRLAAARLARPDAPDVLGYMTRSPART
jgi:hypothetical protein